MISLNHVVFSFKIYFSFSFCSDFNLEATVVKQTKFEAQNNCLSHFLFFGQQSIAYKKNHVKNNNDNFQLTVA